MPVGMLEHVDRHLGHAAELARQRPFGAGAVAQDAAEHAARRSAGRSTACAPGDLLDLGLAIDREEAHAELEGARDVALLLDRVAEGDAVGRRAGGERQLDLDHARRCRSTSRARPAELSTSGSGIRLHGVEHAGVRQSAGELRVVVAHDVEVDDEARAIVGPSSRRLRRNSRMRSVMALSPSTGSTAPLSRARDVERSDGPAEGTEHVRRQRAKTSCDPRAMETRRTRTSSHPAKLPWIGWEYPVRTPGKEKQASSVPTFGGPTRPKKPVRRCFKLRPPWRAGFAGFASGCRLERVRCCHRDRRLGVHPTSSILRSLAAVRPLVRMPTNRHATTGTCEIGQAHEISVTPPLHKCFFERFFVSGARPILHPSGLEIVQPVLTDGGRRKSGVAGGRGDSWRDGSRRSGRAVIPDRCARAADRSISFPLLPRGPKRPERSPHPMPILSRRILLQSLLASVALPVLAQPPALAQQPPAAQPAPARPVPDDVPLRGRRPARPRPPGRALREPLGPAAGAAQPARVSTPTATSASGPTGPCWRAAAVRSACSSSIWASSISAP